MDVYATERTGTGTVPELAAEDGCGTWRGGVERQRNSGEVATLRITYLTVLATHPDKPSLLRTLLILGRVSNLPTVWSNCLAGWLLSDGKDWSRFGMLGAGASLLYIGGMYLNDACDVRFDTQHRNARPIPAGHISARLVWILSAVLLLTGIALLALLGQTTALAALGLVACIVAYDLVHKKTAFAPILMAGCRFLLYVVAAAATNHWIRNQVLLCAGALALFIVALSFIARKEAHGVRPNLLVLPLFIAPLVTGHLGLTPQNRATLGLIGLAYVAWVIWSLSHMIKGGPPAIGRTVSALLAGIVLVDMLAVQGGGGLMPLAFLVLFVTALILQRVIPAT